ncbi:MAG: metallophosphoesterase [Aureispira sp.]
MNTITSRPLFAFFGLLLLIACESNPTPPTEPLVTDTSGHVDPTLPTVLSSFVFVGCNRVDRHDTAHSNASTANLPALQRIYQDIVDLPQQPELFFFLGDMVLGETNIENLNKQLKAWVELYQDTSFSTISQSGIELVAVPGNHEMLYYGHGSEWPLRGATERWIQYMHPFIPTDAQRVTGPDSLNNRATFSFKRGNVGFVVMNTDTYNYPTSKNEYGLEGQIPVDWIGGQIAAFKADNSIEHIFVLGHKPYYVMGQARTDHTGLADGPELWPLLEQSQVVAMLSAHVHDYYREQPQDTGTYQIIAGNAGSPGTAAFFGYSIINIMSDGTVELDSRGFTVGDPYYKAVPNNPMTSRDQTTLTWEANQNPYPYKNTNKKE